MPGARASRGTRSGQYSAGGAHVSPAPTVSPPLHRCRLHGSPAAGLHPARGMHQCLRLPAHWAAKRSQSKERWPAGCRPAAIQQLCQSAIYSNLLPPCLDVCHTPCARRRLAPCHRCPSPTPRWPFSQPLPPFAPPWTHPAPPPTVPRVFRVSPQSNSLMCVTHTASPPDRWAPSPAHPLRLKHLGGANTEALINIPLSSPRSDSLPLPPGNSVSVLA